MQAFCTLAVRVCSLLFVLSGEVKREVGVGNGEKEAGSYCETRRYNFEINERHRQGQSVMARWSLRGEVENRGKKRGVETKTREGIEMCTMKVSTYTEEGSVLCHLCAHVVPSRFLLRAPFVECMTALSLSHGSLLRVVLFSLNPT